ncbi:uncharacterized protein DC041_0009258 [Schistosoma bovis]|uniref:G-protein coupled receptors family 1 profile domain-containing protein n=1 Tax=Schistosoma bovis TaxID=6184 RepID=A0A430QAJ7_SCHBO|nr:uncharacterized protein DC041_0009258 [Schistosoma bovis]
MVIIGIRHLIYTVITFILQFVAPCLIISICYYRVSCVLRSRGSTKIGSGRKSREKEELEIKRNRRTNQMLIAMVIIFVVCWIPLNVLWIVVDIIGEKAEGSVYFHHTFILCHMIAMSSAVYNPFIYAWLNNNFRQEFKAIFQCNNKFCSKNSSLLTTRQQTQSKFISRYTYNNNDNKKAKNDHMDFDNEENINNQLKMHKSIDKPKGQHTSYMTIADGDGGVWQGPVCSEIK